MIRTVPISIIQEGVYKTLTACVEGYEIVDDSTPFENGKMPKKSFGVIGPITAVPEEAKTDTAIWNVTVTIDVYSNYPGKKEINAMVDDIVYILTAADITFEKYKNLNQTVEMVEIRAEDTESGEVWQHGSVRIIFKVEQERI